MGDNPQVYSGSKVISLFQIDFNFSYALSDEVPSIAESLIIKMMCITELFSIHSYVVEVNLNYSRLKMCCF